MPNESRRVPTTGAQALMFIATGLAMLGNYYVYDSIAPVAELLTRQLGFSDTQLGSLNAIYSLPNVFLVLVGGVLVDRLGARLVVFWTTAICLAGAVFTQFGSHFPLMLLGRFLFGVGAETLVVAITVALAQWFLGRWFALFFALNISVSRLGSYLADRSPSFAHSLYEQGWQPALGLATAFAVLSMVGAAVYWYYDRREERRGTLAIAPPSERIDWHNLLRFRAAYWYIVAVCVAFYAVIFPFRSTFAIKYFEQAHGLSLKAAGNLNSYVFGAAVFVTPVFGLMVDRFGKHALLLVTGSLLLPISFLFLTSGNSSLWVSTVLLGVSFSLVPAVLWPSVARHVKGDQLGTAYGLMTMLQNAGLTLANVIVGYLNDRGGASAAHAQGYAAMLWFFGLLSLAGFLFSLLLLRNDRVVRA
ncbi:MAG TPA: MFS transporter [Steroidobacteraceae bacterium]|nr:MFS transporter [Steroidobacteraceae bacterium]